MLKLIADLHFKNKYIISSNCVVEKTIRLSGEQFDQFSVNLLKDWDFIKENNDAMHIDKNGAYHCLLVIGERRENGILVQSEGHDYARYAAYVPHVHSIVALNRYPAFSRLCQRLEAMADYLVTEAMQSSENPVVVNMDELDEKFGLDVARNRAIVSTLTDMLNDHPNISDWELNGKEFVITPAPEMAETVQAPEQDAAQTMSM